MKIVNILPKIIKILTIFLIFAANMKRKVLFPLLVGLLLTLGGACSRQTEPPVTTAADTTAVDPAELILRVRKTSRLYTAEYRVHKIVTHEDVRQLSATVLGKKYDTRLPLGDRKVAIPIDVTLRAYVDFSTFSERQVERSADGRHLHVTLPDPRVVVTSSRVDHAETKQFVDILRSDYSDEELADFTAQGVHAILLQVPELGILETARQSAAATLIPLFAQMGYEEEDILVTFRKEFNSKDLPFYFDGRMEQLKTLVSTDR